MRVAQHRRVGAGSDQTSPPGESAKGRSRFRRLSTVHRGNCLGTTGKVVVNAPSAYLAAMTDSKPTIDETLAELVESFDLLGDWESRIGYVIDLGKDLEPLPETDRVDANKVPGCAAQVWLSQRQVGDRLVFYADSDSALSKGNIALLLQLYSDRTPDQILAFDARAALDRLGLPQALTRQRANGLNNMVGQIREAALAVTASD